MKALWVQIISIIIIIILKKLQLNLLFADLR